MELITVFFFVLFTTVLMAQPLTPEEESIPVRDGQSLAADVYVPQPEIARPTILIQTPYNKYYFRYQLPLGIGVDVNNSPYNFVIVDWRGFYASSDAASASADRGEDGYDIIDWVKDQSWSDGKIGTWGASALGKIQFQTAREQHPNHICAVPLVASPEFLYAMYYPNGVYREEYVEQLDALGYGMSSVLEAHPYYDLTWQYAEAGAYYPEQIQIPVLMIGGWYDHATNFVLKFFDDLCDNSPAGVAEQHKLMMGPWAHGGFGPTQVGTSQQGDLLFPEAAGASDDYAREFFDYYLLNAYNGWLANPVVKFFQMGEMSWHEADSWPVSFENVDYYLQADGSLSIIEPGQGDTCSSFVYDPRDPSPTIGGATLHADLLQGPYDQSSEVESRSDIRIFETGVIETPVEVAGKVIADLYVSSNRTDTDFALRLCDVYPDGRSMLLAEGVSRMRFRNGFTGADESLITPGEVYEIQVEFPDVAQTFPVGHKIRLDVTSSNYPRFNRNINNGEALYTAGDTLTSVNAVYHSSDYASKLILPIPDNSSETPSMPVKGNDVRLYPNPAKSGAVVHFAGIPAEGARLYSTDGKLLYEIQSEENRIPLSKDMKPGIYILEIYRDKAACRQKLVVY